MTILYLSLHGFRDKYREYPEHMHRKFVKEITKQITNLSVSHSGICVIHVHANSKLILALN